MRLNSYDQLWAVLGRLKIRDVRLIMNQTIGRSSPERLCSRKILSVWLATGRVFFPHSENVFIAEIGGPVYSCCDGGKQTRFTSKAI